MSLYPYNMYAFSAAITCVLMIFISHTVGFSFWSLPAMIFAISATILGIFRPIGRDAEAEANRRILYSRGWGPESVAIIGACVISAAVFIVTALSTS